MNTALISGEIGQAKFVAVLGKNNSQMPNVDAKITWTIPIRVMALGLRNTARSFCA
jgi:hypothetical protein